VDTEVVIVGAGVAGLACALELQKSGVPFALLEKQDGVGGRVRTDIVDGFVLDRGFQIFLTAYPTAQEILDYDALRLNKFYAGADVRWNGNFHRVADPLRHPIDGLLTLSPEHPIGSVQDKILVGVFRFQAFLKSLDVIFSSEETSIAERLVSLGFSESMIDRFFRPFLGGIFFDRQLGTTSRLFEFVMKMLATGSNTLPERGIGAVSDQLAERLPPKCIHLNSPVSEIKVSKDENRVEVVSATTTVRGKCVVVATEGPVASELLQGKIEETEGKEPVGTVCLYFWTDEAPPSQEPMLYLNGESSGIVNNCCFPSTVCSAYAPRGKTLVSVSLIINFFEDGNAADDDEALASKVKEELCEWFGESFVSTWTFLKAYRIPYAQPNQQPPTNFAREVKLDGNVFVCGDHRDGATLEGALKSGRRAALQYLGGRVEA